MAVKTKPVRLFEQDDRALEMLAAALHRSRSDVVHAALREYVVAHRDELSAMFAAAQRALADGDIDALVAAAAPALEQQMDDLMAEIPRPDQQ